MQSGSFTPSRADYLEFKRFYGRPKSYYYQREYAGTIFETMTFGEFIDSWDEMVKGIRDELWVRLGADSCDEICLGNYTSYGTYEREMLRDHLRKKIGLDPIGFF